MSYHVLPCLSWEYMGIHGNPWEYMEGKAIDSGGKKDDLPPR
jgi:hypothetical protein